MAKRQTQLDRLDKIVDGIIERNPNKVCELENHLEDLIKKSRLGRMKAHLEEMAARKKAGLR